jgi:DNA-binding GntR family transcriptional regulator
MSIERRPLRDLIAADVLGRLQAGLYPVGTRVDELALASELEVSRTPVREALSQLAYEGIFETRMGKGFWVAPLTAQDLEDAYPIIVTLEGLALASIDASKLEALAVQLHAAADAMERVADSPEEAQQADDAWHELLVESAENLRLATTLKRIKQSVRRAEYHLMRNREVVLRSVGQHRAIADALARGDIVAAAGMVDHNWRDGLREMLNNLRDPLSSPFMAVDDESTSRSG